ncbi:MAG: hypothetical protein IPL32_18785 [Chloracidobacterium sp.]|nr:hypothetical protein [Chloracidobacterium sp.]
MSEPIQAVSRVNHSFQHGTWYPISDLPPLFGYVDAFTVMRAYGAQDGPGVRMTDVRFSIAKNRFEDTRGQPVELIDDNCTIYITHFMLRPPPPSNGDRTDEAESLAVSMNPTTAEGE